jgi:tetratricopeptide (TPR) repeat protein
MLQRSLAGKDRTILYRDPAEQRDHFAAVLGSRLGKVALWSLPVEVETRLFTDARFVESIQSSLFLFRSEYPLLYARVKQLRGEFDEAIEDYVRFRFAEKLPQVNNKKAIISDDVQDGLNVYSTYYLALAHLDRNNLAQAELMLRKLLEILPEAGPNLPFYNMFRWGANANLGRIYEAKNDLARAIAYDTQNDPTSQYVGNFLRARELVWKDPIAGTAVTLPPPPPPRLIAPRQAPQPARLAPQGQRRN